MTISEHATNDLGRTMKRSRSSRVVHVVVTREVSAPAWAALEIVQDLRRIADFEPKVTAVSVQPAASHHGNYEASGRLLRIAWRGNFSYRLTEAGFYSRTTAPISGVTVAGGFTVAPRQDGCAVTHFERYLLPSYLGWAHRAVRRYIQRTMNAELATIDTLARRVVERQPLEAHP